MPDEESFQEKTKKATPKRIRDAREKGQVARSQELSPVGVLLVGIMSLMVLGPYLAANLKGLATWAFGNCAGFVIRPDTAPALLWQVSWVFAKAVAPVIGLIPLVDAEQGGDLLDRVATIRKQLAQDLGVIVPPIRIRDNVQLKPNLHELKLKGVSIARYEMMVDHLLAINPGHLEDELEGFDTTEPAFGMKAKWIIQNYKELAEMKGFTVIEPAAVIATHLTEIIKSHASGLFTRQDVRNLLERVKRESPPAVEEVVPEIVSLSTLQKVLQNLLAERVSIRDAAGILEVLADYGSQTKEPDVLTEYVRMTPRRNITTNYMSVEGRITVCTLEPQTEKLLADNVQATKQGLMLVLSPAQGETLTENLKKATVKMAREGYAPIILVSPNVRLALRRYVQNAILNIVVLSHSEITPEIEVYSNEVVNL
ncbi:MAG: FHIPEP family type III secretion protein [candidate division Zixibacteria bacterium]|nr:FHIPEP family type III secretion protein [candidate division Zixibacteria bacterium]